MNRLFVIGGLAALPLFTGCSLFGSNSVPPTPDLTGVQAQLAARRDAIHLSPHGGEPTYEPLAHAEDAVNAAESQQQVENFDSQSLSEAQKTLKEAKTHWHKVAGNKRPSDKDLAEVADKALRAERLAQIAQYTAKREIGLKQLNELQSQQQPAQPQNGGLASAGGTSSGDLARKRVVPEMLGNLQFQSGTARLTSSSHAVIGRLAKLVQAHSGLGVAIFGFTSASKPPAGQLEAFIKANPKLKNQNLSQAQKLEAYNQGLSDARARDVAELLVKAGVDPHRIGVRGMGASHPAASNSSASGRRKNDRVEAIMMPLKQQQGGGG